MLSAKQNGNVFGMTSLNPGPPTLEASTLTTRLSRRWYSNAQPSAVSTLHHIVVNSLYMQYPRKCLVFRISRNSSMVQLYRCNNWFLDRSCTGQQAQIHVILKALIARVFFFKITTCCRYKPCYFDK